MSKKILIKGACIISMDAEVGLIPAGDLLIEDAFIREIGPQLEVPEAEVIDAGKMILLPGFIDTHVHAWQAAIRGIGGEMTLPDYLGVIFGQIAWRYTPEDIYLGNLITALTQLNAGITTIFDWSHALSTPAHADSAVEALQASGIRAIFGYGPPPSSEYWNLQTVLRHPEDARRLRRETLLDDNALVTMALALRGTDSVPYEVTADDIRLGRELGLIMSEHMAAFPRAQDDETIRRRAKDGLLGDDINFAHGNNLSERDYQILADHGVSVSITPEIELQMGFGFPVTGRCLAVGISPILGSDVPSVLSGDMFTQMRMALQSQRALDTRRILETGKLTVSTLQALEFATINGARALKLDNKIGSLKPGKQADLIMIRSDDLNMISCYDPVDAVVYYANPSNVDTVFVAGKVLKQQGQLVYAGLAERKAQLISSGQRILGEAFKDLR